MPDIKDVPCITCQISYTVRHTCQIPEYCPCDNTNLHTNQERNSPGYSRSEVIAGMSAHSKDTLLRPHEWEIQMEDYPSYYNSNEVQTSPRGMKDREGSNIYQSLERLHEEIGSLTTQFEELDRVLNPVKMSFPHKDPSDHAGSPVDPGSNVRQGISDATHKINVMRIGVLRLISELDLP